MHEVRSIAELLTQIRRGEILLPEFQRGYVWNSDQVRGLLQSLYRKHPTGHLLVWKTYKPSPVRGAAATTDGHSLLLLDGQQRLTSLYVLFEGKAPPFYEGESLFANLYFNVQTEEFRFWQKTVMEKNPAWIGEPLAVSVDCELDRGMPELPLHIHWTLSLLLPQSGERMPKAMGMEVEREAGSLKSSLKDLAHTAGIEQLPVLVAKDPRRHLRPLAPESLRLPLELKSFHSRGRTQ